MWVSAAGCMRNYLILREKAAAFRADPEVTAAMTAARVPELSQPTLAPGETLADLANDDFDVEAAAERGYAVRAAGPAGAGPPFRRPLTDNDRGDDTWRDP